MVFLSIVIATAMVLNYRKHRPWAESLSIVLQIGLTMIGCIVSCFFAGRYLDRWLGSGGVLTILLTLFGIVGGAVVSYRQIMEILATESSPGSGDGHGND
jgi:F0F1-type ATP synthase assembly protein I